MDEQHSDDSSNFYSYEYEEEIVPAKRQRFSRPKVCDGSFWSNENIKKLIAAIKVHKAIWQIDSEAFKSRVQREAAWQKVFEVFDNENIDTNQLVAKWQNLRTQYRSVRAAARKSAFKKPAWRFYNEMSFIDGVTNENIAASITTSSPEQAATNVENNLKTKRVKLAKVAETAFWNDENILKLINAIKQRKSIWHINDENFQQRNTRETDWLGIADEFKKKIEVNQLVAKWQNLRTSYRAAKNLKDTSGGTQKSNWKYYDFMTFLDESDVHEKVEVAIAEVIEELEDIESNEALEHDIHNDASSEALIQSDYEDNVVKEEHIVEQADGYDGDLLHKIERDNIEIFGNFFISELRKIKNEAYLETTKRKILQFLWQCIDEEPGNT